jgi:hypothetical protein
MHEFTLVLLASFVNVEYLISHLSIHASCISAYFLSPAQLSSEVAPKQHK